MNTVNVHEKQQNFKTLTIARSSAKSIHIKLKPCLNSYKNYKMIEQVEAT